MLASKSSTWQGVAFNRCERKQFHYFFGRQFANKNYDREETADKSLLFLVEPIHTIRAAGNCRRERLITSEHIDGWNRQAREESGTHFMARALISCSTDDHERFYEHKHSRALSIDNTRALINHWERKMTFFCCLSARCSIARWRKV